MNILVIAQHDNAAISPATLNAMTAAREVASHTNTEIHLLVAGSNCGAAAESAAAIEGASQVILVDSPVYAQPLAENLGALVADIAASGYSHVIAASTSLGKDFLPRAAALLGVGQVSDIISVESANSYKRPIYAGNAIATVESLDAIQVISVRTSAFDATSPVGSAASVTQRDGLEDSGSSQFVSEEMAKSDRPELATAARVVSAGRGIGSAENLAVVEGLADKLGAALGASRAAVDAGFVSNDLQVGQTGKIVAPQLYVAVGISGAIQHLAGMKDSKVIVAINKDEEAPIFQVADYGLVGDLFEAVPEFSEKL